MFTKKTRIFSALLAVCVLLSMLTCFVVPASAATVDELLDLKHTLRFNEDGEFKILYLSDLHGQGTKKVFSEQTKANIKTLVEREKPDLVLLLGDNQQRCTTIEEFKTLMDSALKYLDEQKIPWAHVFGNHDEQKYFDTVPSNTEQQAVFEEYEYCISKDVESLDGVGNYLLPILSAKDDTVAFNLWCMDYKITQNNINWYIQTSNLLQKHYGKKIYGIFNSHIPLPEFETAWANRDDDYTGIKNEDVLHNGYNKGVFDQFLIQDDLTGIVAGHDHTNDFALDYKGIKLCYAGTASNDGYCLPGREGARVITLNESDLSTFDTYMSYIEEPVIKDGPPAPLKSGIHQDFSDPDSHYLISGLSNYTYEDYLLEQLDAKISADRGREGSSALAFTRNLTTPDGATDRSRYIELEIDLENYGALGNNKYLRVWMDLTGNNGDKNLLPLLATTGLIMNYDYDPNKDFSTLNKGGKQTFYYMPEGGTQWETFTTDKDGCFGMFSAKQNPEQDQLSMRGKKGWFAFPIENMLSSQLKRAPAADDIVTGIYLGYALDHYAQNDVDYITNTTYVSDEDDPWSEYVFVDDIALVKDYKVFTEDDSDEPEDKPEEDPVDKTGEVISATGLTDVSDDTKYPDIKNGLVSGITTYKVTDYAGMVKLSDLAVGNALKNYTFIMANDIDMEWKNFAGIGNYNKSFEGSFDGNGFVIENLLILNPYGEVTGLFPQIATGTIKNVGIASGFVFGGDNTATRAATSSLVGYATRTASIYNCWSAATVWGEYFTGGLLGNGALSMINCYQLGSVYITGHGGVLYGQPSLSHFTVNNSYAFADSVIYNNREKSAWMARNQRAAFGYTEVSATAYKGANNNAFVTQSQGYTSYYEENQKNPGAFACDDAAKEFSREDIISAEAIARLNTDIKSVGVDDYTVQYDVIPGVPYPVLSYYKDGEVVVRRVARTTDNVGENTLAEKSDLFAHYSAHVNEYYTGNYNIGKVQIKNAADLLALAMIVANDNMYNGTSPFTRMGITGIEFTNDIDMTDLGIFEDEDGVCRWDSFLPIGASYATMKDDDDATNNMINTMTIEGGGHVIKNWKCRLFSSSGTDHTVALFTQIGGATIQNLGMEDAVVTYDVWETDSGRFYRAGILVGSVVYDLADKSTADRHNMNTNRATIKNCWVTGKILMPELYGGNATIQGGGLVGWFSANNVTISDCWVDVDADYDVSGYTDYTKLSALGSTFRNNIIVDNVYYVAGTGDKVIQGNKLFAKQTGIITDNNAEAAWTLNQNLNTYWTLNAQNGITKGTEATQIRKLTLTNGEEEFTVYGKSGETVDLAKLLEVEKAVFTAAAEEVGSIDGMTFTFGTGDDAYTFTTKTMLVADEMVGDYLYKDGVRLNAYQLAEYNGAVYFVHDYHRILKNATVYVGEIYVQGSGYDAGYYTFDKEGVMTAAAGVVGDYYYKEGKRVAAYTLIEDGEDYYYVSDGGKLAKNQAVYLTIDNVTGYYWFDEDGKLGGEAIDNGYAYKAGKRVSAYTVVEIDGATYYVSDGHKIAKNGAHWVTVKGYEGYHYFDKDGKLGGNGVIDGFVYKDGVRKLAYQLVEINGAYYFVNDGHRAAVNTKLYLSANVVKNTDLAEGWYEFDADGKLILPQA